GQGVAATDPGRLDGVHPSHRPCRGIDVRIAGRGPGRPRNSGARRRPPGIPELTMKAVYVVGTLDTKREELAYVRDVVEATGVIAVLVDVGTTDHQSSADVKAGEVASHHPSGAVAVASTDRGEAVGAMA